MRDFQASDRFDEATYLDLNPDVKAAVASGAYSSGFQHYITDGQRNKVRPGAPKDLARAAELYLDCLPPPASLRLRVSGSAEFVQFVAAGQVMAANLVKALPPNLVISRISNVLDFGCGCGRIAPAFRKLKPCTLWGTDIDAEAIEWCAANLSAIGTFDTNMFLPPLRYEDDMFDLVYSVSIFTHLPEDMQFLWLADLARVIKPGGYGLLTVQGEWLFPHEHVSEQRAEEYEAKGFSYLEGDLTEGLPEFYRTTIHSDRYVREAWSEFFEIKAIIPRGINNHQDIVVCRAR